MNLLGLVAPDDTVGNHVENLVLRGAVVARLNGGKRGKECGRVGWERREQLDGILVRVGLLQVVAYGEEWDAEQGYQHQEDHISLVVL